MRVLIAQENEASFRADGDEFIFVKGISANQIRIKSLNLNYRNKKITYSIDNKINSTLVLPENFNLIIQSYDKRGIWYKNRRYAGELKVYLNKDNLQIINHLKLEKYLKSVVGSEMPKEFPLAALQAQAIAARTYALKLLGKNKLFDIHSTQASQVYLGLEAETPKINKAVRSTNKLALFYKDKLIDAVFHSSSGGRTENSGQVWRYQLPYLKSVIDYDQNSTKYKWSKKFNSSELDEIFSDLGGLNGIQTTKKSKSNRVLEIRLFGPNGENEVSGKSFRRKLKLLSTKFDVNLKYNHVSQNNQENIIDYYNNISLDSDRELSNDIAPNPLPEIPKDYYLVVKGYGAGHGVGMSQWGAKTMAERGYGFRNILNHYYTGIRIKAY